MLPQVDKTARSEILGRVADAILFQASSGELRELRTELAGEFNLSPPQVRATSAWLTIRANQVLKAAGLGDALVADDVIALDRYLSVAGDADRQEAIAEVASSRGCSVDSLRRIASILSEITAPERKSDEAPTAAAEVLEVAPRRVDAAHVDYDFPTKEAWRQKWADFISRHFSPGELQRATVICLPSQNCELEIGHYLDLGIRPGNIVAVEGNPRVREAFEASARRLGVVSRFGSLEEVAASLSTRFSIVNYDFPGPISVPIYRALANTLLAEKAVIILNVLGRRDRVDGRWEAEKVKRLVDKDYIEKLSLALRGVPEIDVPDLIADWQLERMPDAHTFRVEDLPRVTLSRVGAARAERYGPLQKLRRDETERFPKEFRDGTGLPLVIPSYFTTLGAPVLEGIADLISNAPVVVGNSKALQTLLRELVSLTTLQRNWVTALERYCYHSEVSKAGTPFSSLFAVVETPYREHRNWAPVTSLLGRLCFRDAYSRFHAQNQTSFTVALESRSGEVINSNAIRGMPADQIFLAIDEVHPDGKVEKLGCVRLTVLAGIVNGARDALSRQYGRLFTEEKMKAVPEQEIRV